jgi:phosphonate transport system substrate-binding protein
MNIIEKRAEVGAFCNTCVAHYIEFTKGNFDDPKPGDIVKILPNAPAPFDKLAGEEVVLIASVPVLNECIAVNQKVLTEEQVAALTAALTSDEAAANTAIFGSRKDPVNPTLFEKGHRFVKVEDAWYNPFRTMSNLPLR